MEGSNRLELRHSNNVPKNVRCSEWSGSDLCDSTNEAKHENCATSKCHGNLLVVRKDKVNSNDQFAVNNSWIILVRAGEVKSRLHPNGFITDRIYRPDFMHDTSSVRKRSSNLILQIARSAKEGMLLKLDFRDEFKLEESADCRYDFLEVRDGQHGYSNLLGNFCGTNFPPEITSKTRYLWLRFHSDDSIEGKGFKAVWNMIPRPTDPGVPPEPEPCVRYVNGVQAIISSEDVHDRKTLAEKEGIPLDCMWNITVKEGWKIEKTEGKRKDSSKGLYHRNTYNFQIQLTFSDPFKLQRPNECEANFVDIFKERTDMSSREKNFCGSIADTVLVGTNTAFVRFYAEPKALNSSFEAVMTALRDRDSGDKREFTNILD
ncbi:hypothetical protein K0M31_016024 [Melipona bicolor]|uniref:CUB domain-containing protein n=1 Tax=Melipona bicolor TaxID=60889 RepID=A0AA40KTB5_9HYME|nr:hypothetical protein K0M31_016024 [Melipona bicolor]